MGGRFVELVNEKSLPTRSSGNLNFIEFLYVVNSLLIVLWGEDWGKLVMEGPLSLDSKDIDFPIISFNLKEREPGVISNDGRREITPRKRSEYKYVDDDKETRFLRDEGQRMDAKIEFLVYTTNNRDLIDYTEAFIDVMYRYKGIFIKKGLHNIWFEKDETHDIQTREDVYARKITYHVSFEKIYRAIKDDIESVEVDVQTLMERLADERKLPF